MFVFAKKFSSAIVFTPLDNIFRRFAGRQSAMYCYYFSILEMSYRLRETFLFLIAYDYMRGIKLLSRHGMDQ